MTLRCRLFGHRWVPWKPTTLYPEWFFCKRCQCQERFGWGVKW